MAKRGAAIDLTGWIDGWFGFICVLLPTECVLCVRPLCAPLLPGIEEVLQLLSVSLQMRFSSCSNYHINRFKSETNVAFHLRDVTLSGRVNLWWMGRWH